MIKRLVSFLACFAALSGVARGLTLEELQAQLAAQVTVRCQFVQERQISGLERPLRARGELIVSREQGLWWHQQRPFEMTLLLDANRMVQTLAGQPAQVITAENNPQLFQFNHLLVAVFRADQDELRKNFDVSFTGKEQGGWELVLVPRAVPLNKIFRRITLSGAQFVEGLVLEDMQNDRTTIHFSQHRTEPMELSETEKEHFAGSY